MRRHALTWLGALLLIGALAGGCHSKSHDTTPKQGGAMGNPCGGGDGNPCDGGDGNPCGGGDGNPCGGNPCGGW